MTAANAIYFVGIIVVTMGFSFAVIATNVIDRIKGKK